MVTTDTGTPGEFEEPPAPGFSLPPWEERERYGFLNALYLTVKEVLLYPGAFFARMPTRIGLVQPALFAIVMGVLGSFFMWMWSLTFSSLQVFFEDNLGDVFEEPLLYGFAFVTSPVLTLVDIFVTAGITHLCLLLVGGNRFGFEATFRVIAYAQATSLLAVFPGCGVVLMVIWFVILVAVGLQRIHDTDLWRSALAIILPAILCLAGCGGFFSFLFGLRALSS